MIRYTKSKLSKAALTEYAEDMRRISHWMASMEHYLDLRKWTIVVTFKKTGGAGVEARTTVNHEYKSAHITFCLKTMNGDGWTWEDKRNTVVHEMLHTIVDHHTTLACDLMSGDKGSINALRRDNESMVTVLSWLPIWNTLLLLDDPPVVEKLEFITTGTPNWPDVPGIPYLDSLKPSGERQQALVT